MKNRFQIEGEVTRIQIKHKGEILDALIDTGDVPRADAYLGTWGAAEITGRLYPMGKQHDPETGAKIGFALGRWLLEATPDIEVRYRNGDPLDARRANLEAVKITPQVDRTEEQRWQDRWQKRREGERHEYLLALAKRLARVARKQEETCYRWLVRNSFPRNLAAEVERQARLLEREPKWRAVFQARPKARQVWHDNLDSIVKTLSELSSEWVGRADVERIFAVSRRTACKLLDRFGATELGRSLQIPRQSLIERLQRLASEPEARWEATRREALYARLEEAHRHVAARSRVVTVKAETGAETIAGLPATVRLAPGLLTVEFFGTEDLLRQLMEIAFAIQNDFARFEAICEGPAPNL